MKIVSPLPHRRGRLEIIPLIDIMFFLLAAFMLVSIDKIRVKSLKVNLPTNVPTAQVEKKQDFITISVDADGRIQVDKELVASKEQVRAKLQSLYAQNKDQKFLIASDKEARSGDLIGVLGELRSAGFQKIAFNIDTKPPLESPAASGPAVVPGNTSVTTPDAPAPSVGAAAAPAGATPVPSTSIAPQVQAPAESPAAAAPAPADTPAPVAPVPTPASANP